MPGYNHSIVVLAALAASIVSAPGTASAASARVKVHRTARVARAPHACAKAPVEVVAGTESATFSLARCDGSAVPAGVDQLSLLARPGSAPKPKDPLAALAKVHGADLAPGVRRIDARLVERLELVVDHFRKDGQPAKVLLVSGYRPRSSGSYHSRGRALDFRVEGVDSEALVAFCKTLPDTGCGYYPKSLFVHMDAREPGTGHVAWIDASGPGETPKYVTAWPPPADPSAAAAKLPALPTGEHSSGEAPDPAKPGHSSEAKYL